MTQFSNSDHQFGGFTVPSPVNLASFIQEDILEKLLRIDGCGADTGPGVAAGVVTRGAEEIAAGLVTGTDEDVVTLMGGKLMFDGVSCRCVLGCI